MGLSTPTRDEQECCKPFLSPFDHFSHLLIFCLNVSADVT